jgi:N-ethylmaleimide reductase
LNRFGLAYLHVIEPRVKGVETLDEHQKPVASALLRKAFDGPIIAAGGFNGDSAEEILRMGDADLVAFGRYFTSNPDLPRRLQRKLPLTQYDRETFWGGTQVGYTDYLDYHEQEKRRAA